MKRLFTFLLSLLMVFSLVACGVLEAGEESSTIESTEEIQDINANAILILEEMLGGRIGNEDFIDTVLAYVPDVFMLEEYRCACWTYFLVMSDGTEYIVIVDNIDYHITSISRWYPEDGTHGPTFYTDYE